MDFKRVEKNWQKEWERSKIFEVKELKVNESKTKKGKFYCLEMFPYPSASFLHMGHVRNYTMGDVIARFKRMQGFNVLYPMGYDSFGLPAENAAKKEKIHPKIYTENAIKNIIEAQKALGNSYDWSRVIATHRPEYYKWNQYFFLKFLEKGLAYRKKAPVNFCPNCNTVLADEEVESGKCWRCETEVELKELDQWFLKTTAYADELLEDLDKLDWSEQLKGMQRNWIGKSKGVEINFKIDGKSWPIFTTRPDTIFGVTFMVISAQHPKLAALVKGTKYEKKVLEFSEKCKKAKAREEIELLGKDGVFTGKYAENPLTGDKVPVWAGNFVVAEYGSGMVMAVPAHDQRDFEFATKYEIPIKIVIQPKGSKLNLNQMDTAFVDEGVLVDSQKFTGVDSLEAIEKISDFIEKRKFGHRTVNYKLRDWLISRQRYWGTPIPIIYCEKCGAVPVPEKELPVLLPEDVKFTGTGNPLLTSKKFQEVKCPKCKSKARRETDTMGGFMDSSWYFLRFCSPQEKNKPFTSEAVGYWMPVNQYVGGIEHAVGHLIYARFFTKALRDLGLVKFDEPFSSLFNHGIVYKDGKKMSKSAGNSVTPDEISSKCGIDTARLFLLFLASPEKQVEWNDEGVEGMSRFVRKVIALADKLKAAGKAKPSEKLEHYTNKAIKEVSDDIENFRFNIAIIKLMSFANYLEKEINKESYETLLKLLSPFAPHVSEELWHQIGNETFVSVESWPKADEKKIDELFEVEEKLIDASISDAKDIMKLSKIASPKKVIFIIADDWKAEFLKAVKPELEKTRNPGEIMKKILSIDRFRKHGEEISKLVPKLVADPGRIPIIILGQQKEFKIFSDAHVKKTCAQSLNSESYIVKELQSKHPKAKQAMPGKPAIVVE